MSWRRREPQPPAHILPLRERRTPEAPTGDATWLLSQVRTAAEARWPGQRIDAGVMCLAGKHVASVVAGLRGFASAHGATEAEALERLLAEVRR
jgi:hypothetical protein